MGKPYRVRGHSVCNLLRGGSWASVIFVRSAFRLDFVPSIGPLSYEVGPEVAALAQLRLPHPAAALHYPNGPQANPHLDLWQANLQLLHQAGVPAEQCEQSAIDTARHTADFFSHRAEEGRCGLFSLVAWLQPAQ